MKKFKDFIKEDKDEKMSIEDFFEEVKQAVMRDFTRTSDQGDAFVKQYQKILAEYWQNGFTVREAIAACKIPGVKISPDKTDESFIFEIDSDFENSYDKINNITLNNLNKAENLVNEYFNKYNKKNYSDERVFNRIKSNYKSLIKIYEEKLKSIDND